MNKGKIVYILGAGCSCADGMPLQTNILQDIFLLQLNTTINTSDTFMDIKVPDETIYYINTYECFNRCRWNVAKFLINSFGNDKQINTLTEIIEELKDCQNRDVIVNLWNIIFEIVAELKVSLEDIFTIFDKIERQKEHWREYSGIEIAHIYEEFKKCIIYVMCHKMEKLNSRNVYQMFCQKLIKQRLALTQDDDKLAILTLNWDTLLEQELYKECMKSEKNIMPDYCFYNYPLKESIKWIPSTLLKNSGFYNIKILKLHGSFNWLVCPRCGRITVDFEDNIAKYILGYKGDKELLFCDYCSNGFPEIRRPKLESLFISPTYLKSLENSNIKNIWQNAFIELSEAEKIVFLGYSLPNADFEFKHLLKEALDRNCKIDVVLSNNDDIDLYKLLLNNVDILTRDKFINKLDLPYKRYESFFGTERINFFYQGVEDYIKESMRI